MANPLGEAGVPWTLGPNCRVEVPVWPALYFRVELLHDDIAAIRQTIDLYQRLLTGAVSGKEVWRALRASNRVGVTRGTLEERRDPLAIL